ncbi:ANTAR domain-containing protein [Paludicola sp. MB14-C6]|uniref:ANTAR domain-containing response regulator n=1 Tax=Paludihabitans sp. MB14-C6 TaxID=3070656 RepID=UPI0027DBC0F2|nr:ANTAR domain-containing protein [Paludicola sp. MB14-C6]WMJ23218.1 ANTAR domain-containing protein [Paludicola sp. MB14-C6]
MIVSNTEKSIAFFTQVLQSFSVSRIVTVFSCSEARTLLLEQDFDLVVINAPLRDESGESLSRHIATKGISQVILVVKSEFYDEISDVVEDYGVITIEKPINKNHFWLALKLAKAAQNKLKSMQVENTKLLQKIEDIRIVDRAKCILISYLNMSESEAHKYIERQAMDTRTTKRAVAEGVLKTYES